MLCLFLESCSNFSNNDSNNLVARAGEYFLYEDDLPNYIFEGPGEILSVKEEYAQVRWRRPVPDAWLKLDQLKEYIQ